MLSLHMGRYPVHIPPCRSRGCALTVVPGHTRSGADDGVRTRGLDPGKVVRYQLRHIRVFCEACAGQYRGCLAASC